MGDKQPVNSNSNHAHVQYDDCCDKLQMLIWAPSTAIARPVERSAEDLKLLVFILESFLGAVECVS